MTNRRDFIAGATATGASLALGGCRLFRNDFETRLETPSLASPNYWCTWCSQAAAKRASGGKDARLPPKFHGDQGGTTRDWMNEQLVFGPRGYAHEFPALRQDLFLVLDDGWDVPYGAPIGPNGQHAFGRMTPHPARFPSLAGTPGEKLAALSSRVRDLGWRGLGLWVSPAAHGEYPECATDYPEFAGLKAREEWKRKLGWCAEGGVGYLKVDWGSRTSEDFRAMMTDIKNEIAPHIVIEHCCVQPPFNGLGWSGQGKDTRRLIGKGDADLRAYERRTLPKSDTWRIYDWYGGFVCSQTIDRTVCDLSLCEATGSRAIVSTEDSLYLGATLGCAFGIMRSSLGTPDARRDYDMYGRLTEVARAVRWARLAPAYPATKGFEVRWSQKTLAESGRVDPAFWFTQVAGKECVQEAPAIVSRGLPLPDVSCSGEAPYVLAGRNPNGAISVAVLPRYQADDSWPTHRAEVTLTGVRLAAGQPLGVFGRVGALAVAAPSKARVLARDLAGGTEHDITASCRCDNGVWTLPGDVLARIGGERTTDKSLPATLVRFA